MIDLQKIGLVLSGGLAKGAYQIGVLKALQTLVNPDSIVAISASSVGVLNAYAYLNHRLETAERVWRSLDCKSMTAFVRTVLKGDFLEKNIKKISDSSHLLEKDFYTALLNTTDKNISYVNLKKIATNLQPKFIRASVALPPFNKPVPILKKSYLDGALVDNIPIAPLEQQSLDCIICVYFDDYDYNFENDDINNKTIKINQQSNMFMKNVFLFKQEYIADMIADGYAYGCKVLENFFENGELIGNYAEAIQAFNHENSSLDWYVTCEVLTKRLNRVSKKYLNRKSNP